MQKTYEEGRRDGLMEGVKFLTGIAAAQDNHLAAAKFLNQREELRYYRRMAVLTRSWAKTLNERADMVFVVGAPYPANPALAAAVETPRAALKRRGRRNWWKTATPEQRKKRVNAILKGRGLPPRKD